jgi:hypothetical protein
MKRERNEWRAGGKEGGREGGREGRRKGRRTLTAATNHFPSREDNFQSESTRGWEGGREGGREGRIT